MKKFAGRRERLWRSPNDESKSMEERFEARLKLAELPRNASPTRIRNRCEITGRIRGRTTASSACRGSLCASSATRA